ncbi:MAG: hypothetical protein PHP85_03235 [Gallionella sp.]|nr:hypothetical protein [Gallionella sp.]
MQNRKSHRVLESFILVTALFAVVMIWLLSHNYHSEYSLRVWAKIIAFGSNDFRLEDAGILFPYIPFYLFWGVARIPGLHTEYTSYLLSVFIAAAVFTHWNSFLVKKGYEIRQRLLLIALVISHPFALWGMTSGLNNALTLAIFYLFCFGIVRLVLLRDVHSILFLSASLAAFFMIDDRSIYIAIVMFPFIPLVAPERMLKESLASVYVILLMPFVFAFLSWMYLNWMFHNDVFMFMHAPEAMYNGVWQNSDQYSWLNQWGGEWIATIGYSLWLSLLAAPATVWMIWRNRRHYRVLHTAPKLFLMPAVATVIGTVGFALFHAVDILYMEIAVFMAALLLLPKLHGKSMNILLALLLVGNLGGWWIMHSSDAPQINSWRNAMLHSLNGSTSDENLAKFLNAQPYSTLIDERAGFRVIASKGNVDNLILPFRLEVKILDKYFLDTVDQFATLNPRHRRSVVDAVGKRFEGIYWGGHAGYHLVYDDQQWRVYRRNDSKPMAAVKK